MLSPTLTGSPELRPSGVPVSKAGLESGPSLARRVAERLLETSPPRDYFSSDSMAPVGTELFPGRAWRDFPEEPADDDGVSPNGSVLVMADWGRKIQDQEQAERICAIAAKAGAIWLCMPAGALGLGPGSGPLRLLKRTHTPKVIMEAELPSSTRGVDTRVALMLLTETETHNVTRFFRAPRGIAPAEVLQDLARLLRAPGGSTSWGWVHRGPLSPNSWRPIDHDPVLEKRQSELSSFGESLSVRDVFQVIVARPGREVPSLGLAETTMPVLTGRDVAAGVIALSEQGGGEARAAVALSAGDLLLPRVEPVSRPTPPIIVQPRHLPLSAAATVIVLRPRVYLKLHEIEFYAAYLGSARSRTLLRGRSQSTFVDLMIIGRLPIPVPDRLLLEAFGALLDARTMFREWAQNTDDVLTSIFDDGRSLAQARVELVDKGLEMRQRRAASEMVTTLDYRIREFYPYPVAYRWRQIQTHVDEGSWRDAYIAALHCAEVHLAYAALICLAGAHAEQVELQSSRGVFDKLCSGRRGAGPTLGDWVNILKELSTLKAVNHLEGDSLLGALRRTLPQTGAVAEAQVRLSERRNDESHLRNLDPMRAEAEAREVIKDLQLLLEQASMLADITLVHLTDNKWDSIKCLGRATVQVLHGDHPLARSEYRNHAVRDLEEGSLYVIDPLGRWTLLRPYLKRSRCLECGSHSIYHPDRQVKGVLQLKALDHGHSTPGPDVWDALLALGAIPGSNA